MEGWDPPVQDLCREDSGSCGALSWLRSRIGGRGCAGRTNLIPQGGSQARWRCRRSGELRASGGGRSDLQVWGNDGGRPERRLSISPCSLLSLFVSGGKELRMQAVRISTQGGCTTLTGSRKFRVQMTGRRRWTTMASSGSGPYLDRHGHLPRRHCSPWMPRGWTICDQHGVRPPGHPSGPASSFLLIQVS